MKKYTKIRRAGHDRNKRMFQNPNDNLVLKEKYDGANFRFTITENAQFLFGSKNVEYKIDGEPDYDENIDGRFKSAIEWVRENCNPENFSCNRTYFVENMVKHSLDYNWDEVPEVIGFDVYDHEKDRYLGPKKAHKVLEDRGIPTACIVDEVKVKDFDPSEYEIPESEYRDGKAEGVVVINNDLEEDSRSGFSTRSKTVTEEFKEKHKEATGARQSVEAIHGHEKIVSKYCTDGRIRKHIEKMKDEGRSLGMELMGNEGDSVGLPMRVSTDIIEEEADSIVRGGTIKSIGNSTGL